MKRTIWKELSAFLTQLRDEERSEGTVAKYERDLKRFLNWLDGEALSKSVTRRWRTELTERGYAAVTVNAMLASLNGFMRFLGREDCRVKYAKVQRRVFWRKELSREEYKRMLQAAREAKNDRLELTLECLASMGVRVGELQFITVEAAKRGVAEVRLKGKVRTILIPERARRRILRYAERNGITEGQVFLTRRGTPLSRKQIWFEMKRLCKAARVSPDKAFPHNLRHLFARSFYDKTQDIVKLADILGHSSIETTRIYLVSSGEEHARVMDGLGLFLK